MQDVLLQIRSAWKVAQLQGSRRGQAAEISCMHSGPADISSGALKLSTKQTTCSPDLLLQLFGTGFEGESDAVNRGDAGGTGRTPEEPGRCFRRAVGVDMASSTSWELPTMPLLAPSEHIGSAQHDVNLGIRAAAGTGAAAECFM